MKQSVAFVAAAAAAVMAEPAFTNSDYDVVPEEPFTLTFTGCEDGCDIILQNGPSDNLNDVQTLATDVTSDGDGGEEEITLSINFPADTYAFKIVDSDGNVNYSEQFEFEGEGEPLTTTSVSTVTSTASSTSAEETTTSEETTSEEPTTSVETTSSMVSSPTSSQATPSPTNDDDDEDDNNDDDDSDDAEETGVPDAAVRLGSSDVTVLAAAVAVLGYFL